VTGDATCVGGNTLDLAGETLAANGGTGNSPYTLTCAYDHPAANMITATLTVKYVTTDNHERIASGSPAMITFTVPADDD
jgi:hypothetical protein